MRTLFFCLFIIILALFLDKEVGYPGTRDIRKAHGLVSKVTEAIKSKLAYVGSYFLYQGIIAWSCAVNDIEKK